MKRILNNWPKLVFVLVPLIIVTVDCAVLVSEHLDPQTEKAIRLVKESRSRKENFTVQQYLYTTVYHRKNKGESVDIDGWRTGEPSISETPVTVELSYTDRDGRHSAIWDADLLGKKVVPRNELAGYLSWH